MTRKYAKRNYYQFDVLNINNSFTFYCEKKNDAIKARSAAHVYARKHNIKFETHLFLNNYQHSNCLGDYGIHIKRIK